MNTAYLTGADKLISGLRVHQSKLAPAVEEGLVRAGLYLQRESMQIVPVDLGNLKASAATRKEGTGFNTAVFVVYTANYAVFVHEDLRMQHQPGKQAKFLEEPARTKQPQIVEIIKQTIADM